MQTQANLGFFDRFFKLREKNTTVKTEVLAGLTTFIALAYIIFQQFTAFKPLAHRPKPMLAKP